MRRIENGADRRRLNNSTKEIKMTDKELMMKGLKMLSEAGFRKGDKITAKILMDVMNGEYKNG